MSDIKWFVLSLVGAVVAALAIAAVVQGADFFLFRTFAPKYEAVRRETFEQSKAYNQGLAQDLQAMQLDYVKATPDQQLAIGAIVLHRLADYDPNKLTPDLQAFVQQVRHDQLGGSK